MGNYKFLSIDFKANLYFRKITLAAEYKIHSRNPKGTKRESVRH